MVDGELLVRQLASPLRGGETVRRFEVGVLLAEEVVLNGAMDNTIIIIALNNIIHVIITAGRTKTSNLQHVYW